MNKEEVEHWMNLGKNMEVVYKVGKSVPVSHHPFDL